MGNPAVQKRTLRHAGGESLAQSCTVTRIRSQDPNPSTFQLRAYELTIALHCSNPGSAHHSPVFMLLVAKASGDKEDGRMQVWEAGEGPGRRLAVPCWHCPSRLGWGPGPQLSI